MNILVFGGTRFFGVPMIEALIGNGHDVTIATRGLTGDHFGNRVRRLIVDRNDEDSIRRMIGGRHYDVVIDKIAYCSEDVKRVLEHVGCDRYIQTSSGSVYDDCAGDIKEEEFDAGSYPFWWCRREDTDYGEGKRQAECALCQQYPQQKSVLVRYPVVLGKDDYTQRLSFYVEHVILEKSMYIDDMTARVGYVHSREAGEFLAYLVEHEEFTGAVNGCSEGSISVAEILAYVKEKTGKSAVLAEDGDTAPYNGYPSVRTMNTDRAKSIGYHFSEIHQWIYDLLDEEIHRCCIF